MFLEYMIAVSYRGVENISNSIKHCCLVKNKILADWLKATVNQILWEKYAFKKNSPP